MRWLLVVAVVGGCGDNTLPVGAPLLHARDLTIVAHPDDDLVFMQPDLLERTVTGGLTNVYVTDGSIEAGARRLGLMAAYTAASGHSGWACGWIDVIGHAAQHCRLEDAHLSLVFLGLPEGNEAGDSPTSIRRLWEGDLDIAITIGDRPASYLRGDVIRVLAELIDLTAPKTIRTLELADTHGPDHADHVITGAVTLLGVAASQSNPELIAFRGESTRLEAPNMIEPLFLRSASILAHYRACAEGCAVCGEACAPVDDDRADFLRRRYAVSLRRTAQGALRSGTECVSADPAGVLALGTCTGIELVVLAADGTLHIGDRCISVQASGDLLAKDICSAGANQRFFFDDEGHIWLGVPPPATPGDALQCLTLDAGVVGAGRCGATTATTWEISPAFVSSPRPQGLTKTGRAVRLADIDGDRRADLCAIETGNLACALGDGTGGFDPAVILHSLAVEPESLMIGDVDGDGLADACGRDAGGITCATAITGFVPERWTLAFAHPGPADASDRSLAAIDADGNGSAEICGLAPPGLVCAGHAGLPVVLSRWPDRNAPLWPADLDGDGHADWCSATATGAACGLALHQLITSDGVPWSFSQAGVVDPAPIDTNTGAVADIDGDGRADLCNIRGNQVVCARSQGFGFGPTAVVSTLPAGSAPTALWLGDLDGNGTADVCVDDAGTIRCIR